MAVYTFIAEDQLRAALNHFPEAGELIAFSPVNAGVTNSNYKVTCRGGTWILTLFELTQDYPHLPFFMEVIARAAAAGLPAPAPLRNEIFTLAGKPAVLCPFFPGSPPPSPPPPAFAAQTGAALGRFHAGARDMIARKENTWSFRRCAEFAAECRAEIRAKYPAAADELERELAFLAEPLTATPVRRGVVHGDLFPDNTLFSNGALSAVLDWYYACEEPLLFDVAVCLNAWCFEKHEREFNFTAASRFVRAYLQESNAEASAELPHLPLFLRFGSVRFLCSRLQAAVFPPPEAAAGVQHDPEAYLRRLLFHRQVPSWRTYADAEF